MGRIHDRQWGAQLAVSGDFSVAADSGQRQRIPVGPHAQSHARTGNEKDWQRVLIRNVRYSPARRPIDLDRT